MVKTVIIPALAVTGVSVIMGLQKPEVKEQDSVKDKEAACVRAFMRQNPEYKTRKVCEFMKEITPCKFGPDEVEKYLRFKCGSKESFDDTIFMKEVFFEHGA